MKVATVAEQDYPVILAHPSRYGISVADLPIQALFRLGQNGGDLRVKVLDDVANLVHVAGLEPRLFDVFRVLVGQDPVELGTATERVLHHVNVLSYPEIDAFFFGVLGAVGVVADVFGFEEGAEACVALLLASAWGSH